MDAISSIFSAFGLSASAGLNAYIPLLVVALTARYTDWITLAPPWDALGSNSIILLLLILATIEFFADKAPAINHLNDIIQTLIRPAAGAILFAASAQVITDVHPVISLGAGLLVAGGVHTAKSLVVRPAVSATTGSLGNTPVSLAEDVVSTTVSLLAILTPFIIALVIVWAGWRFMRRQKLFANQDSM